MNGNSYPIVPSGRNALDARPFPQAPVPWGPPPAEPAPASGNDGWWASLARHRNAIFTLLTLCTGAAFLLSWLSPPVYRAEARVEIQQATPAPAAAGSQQADAAARSEQVVRTQIGLLQSRALGEQVAQSAALAAKPQVLAAIGLPDKGTRPTSPEIGQALQNSLDVEHDGRSNLATIQVDSHDPEVSALLANSYLDNFIEASAQRQTDASLQSRQFLEGRLADAKSRLERSERALISYTRQARLIDPSAGTSSVSGGSAPMSMSSERLMQINQAHSASRAERIGAEQRWNEAQRTPLMNLTEVLNNPAIQQLTERGAAAQAKLEQERQRRTDEHPAVQQALAEINEINRQKTQLAGSIRSSIRERAQIAQRQESQLAGTVNRLENQTLADQGKGVRYNVLKRDADTNRNAYDTLLQRFNEVSMASGLPATTVSVVDRAEAPLTAIAPRPAENAAMGAAAGIALSFLYLFGVRLLDDGVHTPEQLDTKLKVPLLGVLPRVKNPLDELADLGSPLSEAHYSLRTTLELSCSAAELQTILLTSSTEGEGKTSAACGTAMNFAGGGNRTLLIDADMRRPNVHRLFNLPSNIGLSDVLSGTRGVEEAVLETAIPNLSVITSGPIPQSAAQLLSGREFATMLADLGTMFDVIIIDGPPVFGLADGPRLSAVAGSTVFIVEADRTKIAIVQAALRRLVEAKANVVGAVLTKFDIRRSGSTDNLYVYEYRSEEERPRLPAA